MTVALRWFSRRAESKTRYLLGVLPILPSATSALNRPPNPYRAASIITRRDHSVLALDGDEETKVFFEEAFPQLNFTGPNSCVASGEVRYVCEPSFVSHPYSFRPNRSQICFYLLLFPLE